MTKNKILVTGSEGFIGSHLTEKLVREGYKVKALVQYNSFNSYGWLEDVDRDIRDDLEIVMGDIRDPENTRSIIKGTNKILHLAALIAIPYSYHSPQSYIETNILGTLNILQASRDLNVEKIIHTSTSEVYGTAKYTPIDEEHPLQGQSPYSASKIGGDQIALSFYRSYKTPVSILRPFNTYGPRQSARAIIPTVISQIANNKKTISLGSLSPTRDFSYIEDTVQGFLKSMNSSKNIGQVINIGSGFEITMKDLVELISKLMKRKVIVKSDKIRVRPKKSEVERLICCNKKAKKILDWKPYKSGLKGLESGLRKSIKWYQKKENLKKFKSEIFNV